MTLPFVGIGNSVITPAVVMRPIATLVSVNHSAPSGPAVMLLRSLNPGVGIGNSVITPAVVIPPILLAAFSVNHNASSGPVVLLQGPPSPVGTGNSVKVTAIARSATPTNIHTKTFTTSSKRGW